MKQFELDESSELPSHCISMRKAALHCLAQSRMSLRHIHDENQIDICRQANEAAELTERNREEALKLFWKINMKRSTDVMDVVDLAIDRLSPLEFKRKYVHRNIPCIIRNLNQEGTTGLWTRKVEEDLIINSDWFREILGDDQRVPVRRSTKDNGTLDSDGRTVECDIVQMGLDEWIEVCESGKDPSLYLKDWHLVKFLENRHVECPYFVPPHFETDLLNAFLTEFTDGDYRFVYWGPKDSATGLHSDVLNSFSWSFNVAGEKKWTFYPPLPLCLEPIEETPASFGVHQKAGEAMFVPSGWKHTVLNVKETLSVNHNWISTACLDRVWECILCELKSVESEMKEWNFPMEELAPQENMLRGCVGLDVTSFFLMALCNFLHSSQEGGSDECWESCYDKHRLRSLLRRVICLGGEESEMVISGCDQYSLAFKQRIAAVLSSEELAEDLMCTLCSLLSTS